MPCMRVTLEQARILFGLRGRLVEGVLSCLINDGFLYQTDQGEFVRRQAVP